MKKHLSSIFLLSVFLLGTYLNADAQREVVIEGYPIVGGGDITAFVDAIGIALDADAEKTAKKVEIKLKKMRVKVYRLQLPEGEDPNSLGYEQMEKLIEEASNERRGS